METKELKFDTIKNVMNDPEKTKQEKMFFFEKIMYQFYLKQGNRSYAMEFREKGCPDNILCNPLQKCELKQIFGDVIKVHSHPLIVKPGKIMFRWKNQEM